MILMVFQNSRFPNSWPIYIYIPNSEELVILGLVKICLTFARFHCILRANELRTIVLGEIAFRPLIFYDALFSVSLMLQCHGKTTWTLMAKGTIQMPFISFIFPDLLRKWWCIFEIILSKLMRVYTVYILLYTQHTNIILIFNDLTFLSTRADGLYITLCEILIAFPATIFANYTLFMIQ